MADPGDGAVPGRAARLLAEIATTLAHEGASAEDVNAEHPGNLPGPLVDAVAPCVPLPDRRTGFRVVSGLLDELREPGPTPEHWGAPRSVRARALDIAMLLVGRVIGQVFGWAGQQGGRLVHDILPSKGFEDSQVGASSLTSLAWHTEDSFHPDRAALLLLGCVRNPDGIGSRVASIRQAGLAEEHVRRLRRREVEILPDDSYPDVSGDSREPNLMATLWDAEDGLCMRYDPSYTRISGTDPAFPGSYAELGRALDRCGCTVPIGKGDLLLIDNDVAVHGRSSFTPRYDGTDRWLKRVLIQIPRERPAYERLEHGSGQLTVR